MLQISCWQDSFPLYVSFYCLALIQDNSALSDSVYPRTMPPAQHPYPGLFTSEKGFRAFTERLRNSHPYSILIDAKDGGTYPTRVRTTRCSSPTTPPAERRAYAAREQAHKAKAQSTSERSTSLPPQARHTHSHRAHSKREPEPELEYLPQTHKHPSKHHHHHHHHHRKAPKPAERSYRRDSDTESNWSTDVHAPRTPHHSHHHHHQQAVHSDHHTLKMPFSCHCRHCLRVAHQPAEAHKEDPPRSKYFYEPRPHLGPANPKVPCPCGYVHVETVQGYSSRSTSPDKHGKGHGRHSPEPEEVLSHRRRRRRHRRHRHHTTSSSSDTTTDDEDEASLESDKEIRTENEKVGYELPNDWHFCSECCWGHPVIYILR